MSHYTIKDLETLSGIKAHTIRIWEKRYGLLCPERSETNIRYYGDAELRKLLNVSMLVKHGYKISRVSGLSEHEVTEEVLKVNGKKASDDSIIDQLIFQIVNLQDDKFEEIVEKQIAEIGLEDTIVHVFFPLFERIGVFWQVGSIFPAQEHFVSNLLRNRLILEAEKQKQAGSGKVVLFFLKEDEQHELSLLFYNYMALKSGYRTIYLGQNVPFEDLVRTSEIRKVDYVFSAFINAIEKEELEAYLEKMSENVHMRKFFLTGRQVMTHQPVLPRNFKVVPDVQTFKKYFGTIS